VSYLLLCIVTLGGLAWWVMAPGERTQALRAVSAALGRLLEAAVRLRRRRRAEPLAELLRARTPIALVTPILVAANLAVFVGLLSEAGALENPEALLRWGASMGPRTTNGEWWRLVASSFVHAGVVHLAVNLAALVSVGLVLERLVGSFAFAAIYLASAVLGGVAALASSPVDVVAGGSPAIFGLYGLLIASWTWGTVQRATTTVRLRTVARLAPGATAFILYHTAARGVIGVPEQMGLAVGFICGLALARCASEAKPPAYRIAATAAVTACLAIVTAVPLRGVADVRPEIEQLVTIEKQLSKDYDRAVDEFKAGRADRQSLIAVIERSILPEQEASRRRIRALDRVPAAHRPMIDGAETYLRLRGEAWRLRAAALRRSNSAMLREADERERAALEALRTITP
jgi:membrane associated rhomboid family serine protease